MVSSHARLSLVTNFKAHNLCACLGHCVAFAVVLMPAINILFNITVQMHSVVGDQLQTTANTSNRFQITTKFIVDDGGCYILVWRSGVCFNCCYLHAVF